MEQPAPPNSELPLSPSWNWSDLLDFNLDIPDDLAGGGDVAGETAREIVGFIEDSGVVGAGGGDDVAGGPDPGSQGRVRKRDPRMVCSNFLAGRVPCACPELDEAEAKAEEAEQPGRKRAMALGAVLTCQVPECGAYIGGLKGYHKRHRVCLACAGAGDVVIDGKRKRYCQQCGKFHILSAFDEGKRSCRRKLAWHNDRRRRKAKESSIAAGKKPQEDVLSDDVAWDDDIGKDSTSLGSQVAGEPLSESAEGQIPTHCSDPSSQIVIQSNSVISLLASDEQIDRDRNDSKLARPSPRNNRSAYSSSCPTGRISFKLYDWNPAEFPRRLRHQIFDWLAGMPVELEGYIRPGCTILTAFISMPNFMWIKLHEDPAMHIQCLMNSSGKMLRGRDPLIVYLDDIIFHAKRDGTSVMKVKVKKQAPKLHHIHPRCFESGKPIEFIACGSNMLQPKFRFLVSFAGKYIAYGSCVPPLSGNTADSSSHQLLRVQTSHTEPDLFGPAFVEVENESGISNFIPILIGDKEICSEMNIVEHRFESSPSSEVSKFRCPSSLSDAVDVSVMRQTAFSQFILDTAWLLRKPTLEDVKYDLPSSQLTRFSRLLTVLLETKSTNSLKRVLHHMESVLDNCNLYSSDEADFNMLRRNVDRARKILYPRVERGVNSVQGSCVREGDYVCQRSQIDIVSTSFLNKVVETTTRDKMVDVSDCNCEDQSCHMPLINREAADGDLQILKKVFRKSQVQVFTSKYLIIHPLIFTIVLSATYFGLCVVALYPQNVGKISKTIRRCLFDDIS